MSLLEVQHLVGKSHAEDIQSAEWFTGTMQLQTPVGVGRERRLQRICDFLQVSSPSCHAGAPGCALLSTRRVCDSWICLPDIVHAVGMGHTGLAQTRSSHSGRPSPEQKLTFKIKKELTVPTTGFTTK